jgi:Fe-S-cluster containining protein
MSEDFNDPSIKDPRPSSPIVPIKLSLDDRFQFRCHTGIACFNECCKSIDILLTPYDLLRLQKRLGLGSKEFLARHTQLFEMDAHGMPGLKMKTKEGSTECQFLTPEGCGVYEDRPAACRYYALGLNTMRKKDSPEDEDFYFVVKEAHCLGHDEPKTQTVREYRAEQGVDVYDDMTREWRQVILKKRSSGPTVGRPSDRSFDLFFQASYDLDGFRAFVQSASFNEVYDLEPAYLERLASDDEELMRFSFRFLKQSLFGEDSIPVRPDALEKRLERRKERLAQQRAENASEGDAESG